MPLSLVKSRSDGKMRRGAMAGGWRHLRRLAHLMFRQAAGEQPNGHILTVPPVVNADSKKPVIGRAVVTGAVLEIEDLRACVLGLAGGVAPIHGDTVADEIVVLAVVLKERAGEVRSCEFFD